jgi:hypothetical protein
LISRQEHEAWDLLLACQGQLRLGPSGRVIGVDMSIALRLGAAPGCDLAVVSELLPRRSPVWSIKAGLIYSTRSARELQRRYAAFPSDRPS